MSKYSNYIRREVESFSDAIIAEAMEYNRGSGTVPAFYVGTTRDTVKNIISVAACCVVAVAVIIAFILMRQSITPPPADTTGDTTGTETEAPVDTEKETETETEAETETETEEDTESPDEYDSANGEYEYTVNNGEVTINRYIGDAEKVEIPISIDGYPVSHLGQYVLEDASQIGMPVSTGMFTGSSAKHVTIPGSVALIDCFAFVDSTDIETIVIEEGVQMIEATAFIYCTSLYEITIPKSVGYIGDWAFPESGALETVYYLGTEDEWNTLLSESAPDTGLGDVNVVCGVKEDFIYDENLPKTDDFVYTVTNGEVTLVSYIGEKTADVYIPAEINGMKVTRIEKGTFLSKQGKNVLYIIIPPTVESVAEGAYDKNHIGDVYFLGSEERYKEIYEGDTSYKNERIHYRYCYLSEDGLYWYTLADDKATLIRYFGDEEEITVPTQIDGYPVTAIGIWEYPARKNSYTYDGVYEGAVAKKITVPGTVKKLYGACLSGCENLEVLILEEGIEELGSWMLSGSKVKEVVIPGTVTDLGSFASDTLEKVVLPEGLKEISYGAFHDCTALKEVNIPDSVEKIYELAFCNCTSLYDIEVPDSVVEIGYSVFLNTGWYESQPDGEVYAGKVFVSYKGELPENGKVKINKGTIAIAGQAFEGSSIREVEIPNGVVYIGEDAFADCDFLEKIELPPSVEELALGAFANCDELVEIKLNEGLKHIDTWVFISCPKLKTLYLPSTLERVGWAAFGEHETVYFNGTEAEWHEIVAASPTPEACEPRCGVTFLK